MTIAKKGIHKYFLMFLLSLAFFLTNSMLVNAPAAAAYSSPRVFLNNKQLSFDVPPVIENGRTMVPVRAVFEAMGANVEWDAARRVVTATKGAISVSMPINSVSPQVNGAVCKLDVPAKIINGRTLAPLRFVGEAFSGRVTWDSNNRTVYIDNSGVDKPTAVKVNTYLVNLRNGPSTLTAIVDHAHSGEILTVEAEQDGWFKVIHGGQTVWVASWLAVSPADDTSNEPQPITVVLDAGHGGYDPGAVGSTLKEKDVNLKIALKAGEVLQAKGIKVIYTRDADQFVGLEERSSLANSINANLFVAIHINANNSSSPSGTETYFYAPSSNPDLYAQRNERYGLANAIQTALVAKIKRPDHGVKEANFSVLRNTAMPSALVEVAFISNPTEEALMQQDYFINQAAEGIANGILSYLHI